MKVLSIGTDRKLFEENSAVSARSVEYGQKMEELHIVVFTLKKLGFSEKKISGNVTIYPTNSASRWFFVLDAISLGKKIVRENKFVRGDSVVTSQDPFECGWSGWRIAKSFRLPLQLQVHTDFLSPYFKTSFLQKLRVSIAKFLLPRADFVRVVSSHISESMQKAGLKLRNPVRVLPIRIDLESILTEKPQNENSDLKKMFPQFKFIIFMASRLSKEKRIDDAIAVFANVAKKHPHIGLVIAGSGPLFSDLEKKAKELNISDSVIFLGFRDDVFSLMKSANMFLNVSEYEGYGMSLVEAALACLPILSTEVGVALEFLVHLKNSYICPVGDMKCLEDGMNNFIIDNAMRYEMANELFEDVKNRIPSKEEYIRSYVELLEEAAHNNLTKK